MKPFVVLLGTAAFLGFSWVSWSSLRGPIENQLTTTAQTALNEAGLDDVQIKFDHLDGVVSGVQTTEMETKVREIVLSTIPTGRLIFERPESDGADSTTEQNVDPNGLDSEIAATEIAATEIAATGTAADAPNEQLATPLDTLAESDDDTGLSKVAQLDTLESHDNPDETSRFMDAIGEPATAPETVEEPLQPADELAADASSDYTVDIEDLAANDEVESLIPSSNNDPAETLDVLAGDGRVDATEISIAAPVDDANTDQAISEESATPLAAEILTIDAPANPLSLNEPTADTDIASWEYEEVADSPTEIPGDLATAANPNAETPTLTNGLEETLDSESNENSLASEIPPAVEENNYATQLLNQATSTNEEATENQEASNAVEPLGLEPSDEESTSNLESVSDESSFELTDEATPSDANPEVEVPADADAITDADANVTANGEIRSNATADVTNNASNEPAETETAPLEDATQPQSTSDEAQTPTQLEQTGDELPTIDSPEANLTPEANSTAEANSPPATKTTPETKSADGADSAPKGPRPRFGVYLSNNPNDQLVRVVAPGSAAANADIRVGDSIVRFGIRNVTSFEDLSRAVMEKVGGDEVQVWVMRKGELLRKSVKLQSASAPLPPVRAPITKTWNTRKQ